jgi:hypothetical protein
MNRPLQKILRNITSRLASLEQKAESEKSIHENQFEYTEYGLRGDENGKLSVGEIPPKPWVGLTDDEMEQTCYEAFSLDPYVVARAIEAKLKEKNNA